MRKIPNKKLLIKRFGHFEEFGCIFGYGLLQKKCSTCAKNILTPLKGSGHLKKIAGHVVRLGHHCSRDPFDSILNLNVSLSFFN